MHTLWDCKTAGCVVDLVVFGVDGQLQNCPSIGVYRALTGDATDGDRGWQGVAHKVIRVDRNNAAAEGEPRSAIRR
jgi:hypothetical protein